jgi:D-serine deaminase-like pyridoxal phosphate-dependent protein
MPVRSRFSKDRGPVVLDPSCGYGRVLDIEGKDTGMRVTGMSQEHGVIEACDSESFDRLKVGDRVRILANHSCLTAAAAFFTTTSWKTAE